MKFSLNFLMLCLLSFSLRAQKALLPNGWQLTPAGKFVTLGDLPLNMAIAGNGKYIAATNNGLGAQSVLLFDAKTFMKLDSAPVAKSWLGLKFTADSKYLYASGGNDNIIYEYSLSENKLKLRDSVVLGKTWPEKISPTGIEIDNKSQKLYVVTKENNSLYIVDMKTNKVIKQIPLTAEAYTCLLSPDNKFLYISLWGGAKLAVFDTKTETITDSITVGNNPNDLCITKDGKLLFVANSIDNSVSVIETSTKKVIETLNAALFPDAPSGSTTNSVTLSSDNKTLYIANADNNCLAVFDVSKKGASVSKGFIPTGWYPTCVRTLGNSILVLNGKGNSSLPNPKGPQPLEKEGQANYKKGNKKNDQYIGGLFLGTMSVIKNPTAQELADYSKQVYANTPYTKEREQTSNGELGNPIPISVGNLSPIKHVFYIIKENRTYDQVLGDVPEGNGDTSLVLFGKKYTPNQHAIAKQFVLLDNFYVDAEVSADGHNWSMAAYANDYVEKTWPTNYSRRGGTYDYAANKKIALPKNGFLWDYAMRKGISVRDYGEFTDDDGTVYLPELQRHMCPSYQGWNLNVRDLDREQVWEKDFDSLVGKNAVPQLNFLYLPSDHTAGLGKKYRTPYAYVADNDLALGMFLEHLSKSDVWKDCAVFVLEDDAQNGPDHVDAHRSIAFVAGPFVKRNYVDHNMYSTSGMLRTIELILGLPPMSQYDAAANPLFMSFTAQNNATPFTHLKEDVNMDEMNAAINYSPNYQDLDLSGPDRIPERELNDALWQFVKGRNSSPAPKRASFVAAHIFSEDKD